MSPRLRKLNDQGVNLFREYLGSGAVGVPPLDLLERPETSHPLSANIVPGSGRFDDRYSFGIYLRTLLKDLDAAAASGDRNLWTSLSLVWFDELCPAKANGSRDVGEDYRYILSSDYRHYYRHLVRSPWQLVHHHGENARFLLVAPKMQSHPLSVHGEILEQFGGRQQVLASRSIIEAANGMYLDPKTQRPATGVAGSGRGSARRFGLVLRQFDLTYDPEGMPKSALLDVLPPEFDKWKKRVDASNAGKQKDVNSGIEVSP